MANGGVARPLTSPELDGELCDDAAAACRLADAGMDLIEIDAGGGRLVDQFLSPQWNERTDAWGGSLDRRAALLLAMVAAVREAAPGGLPSVSGCRSTNT